MKQQELIDRLVREARQQDEHSIDLSSLEARVMDRISQGDAPRFPSAIPPRRPAWIPAAFGLAAAAAAGLVWYASLSPAAPPVVVVPPTPTAPLTAMHSSVEKFHTGTEGKLVAVPRMASLWLEGESQGSIEDAGERLSVVLDEGAVSLDVLPQPAPDRVEVIAGNFRVSVKGTKFRVARHQGQVEVDVEHGVVQVTPLDGSASPSLLRGPTGGSFPSKEASPSRELKPFVLGPQALNAPPSTATAAGSIASATAPGTPHESAVRAPSTATPPTPQPSLQEMRNRAYALASSCATGSSNVAPGVVVTIETTLALTVSSDGRVGTFSFSPPVSPTIEQCFQKGKSKLRGPTGSHAVPMTLSLGGR